MSATLLLLGGGAGHALGVKWLDAPGDREPWDFALERAKLMGEPIMAYVFVEHMPLCDVMDNQTFRDPKVGEVAGKFLCVRLNALLPGSKAFLKEYGVAQPQIAVADETKHIMYTYPQTVFLAPDGRLVHTLYGYEQPSDFIDTMTKALEIVDLFGKLEQNGNDAKALARLGGIYVDLQRYAEAAEPLQAAMQLDADGKLGVAETALLDLAVTYTYAQDPTSAVEAVKQQIERFPDSDLRCKAQYLLGGAHLAIGQVADTTAEELEKAGDAAGAAAARARTEAARADAIAAWQWFAPEQGPRPCNDPKCEWSAYSLGALAELKAELAYTPLMQKVDALMQAEDYMGAVQELRAFVASDAHKGTEAWCNAQFLIGECLMKAGKRAEALKQWRQLENLKDDEPCAQSRWRAEAVQSMRKAEQ